MQRLQCELSHEQLEALRLANESRQGSDILGRGSRLFAEMQRKQCWLSHGESYDSRAHSERLGETGGMSEKALNR